MTQTHSISTRTTSPGVTERAGARFARTLKPGAVITLSGIYGAGKTTFARGVALGLRVSARHVASPSFVLIKEFPVHTQGIRTLAHIDLWRLPRLTATDSHAIEEILKRPDGITLIEWGIKLPKRFQKYVSHSVNLKITGPTARTLIIHSLHSRKKTKRA